MEILNDLVNTMPLRFALDSLVQECDCREANKYLLQKGKPKNTLL